MLSDLEGDKARENLKRELFERLDKAVGELRHLNVSDAEILEHISKSGGKEERQ